jgi:hypothetical protein
MLHLLITCEIFLFNLFLLMEMKRNKNKIIACTILITLLLNDKGLKIFFLLLCQSIDVLSRIVYTVLCEDAFSIDFFGATPIRILDTLPKAVKLTLSLTTLSIMTFATTID